MITPTVVWNCDGCGRRNSRRNSKSLQLRSRLSAGSEVATSAQADVVGEERLALTEAVEPSAATLSIGW
jgi:hypothetical protein